MQIYKAFKANRLTKTISLSITSTIYSPIHARTCIFIGFQATILLQKFKSILQFFFRRWNFIPWQPWQIYYNWHARFVCNYYSRFFKRVTFKWLGCPWMAYELHWQWTCTSLLKILSVLVKMILFQAKTLTFANERWNFRNGWIFHIEAQGLSNWRIEKIFFFAARFRNWIDKHHK